MSALIAYYSRRGQNLVNGKVETLRVGNTELAAVVLQKFTGADLYQIQACQEYPEDYCQCIDLARQDLLRKNRPKLRREPGNLEQYHIIYLGYPNYWGTMPAVVFTFQESYDFGGKVICPFCTYEDGGMGHSVEDLRRACPTARIAQGLPLRGAKIRNELSAIEEWACCVRQG